MKTNRRNFIKAALAALGAFLARVGVVEAEEPTQDQDSSVYKEYAAQIGRAGLTDAEKRQAFGGIVDEINVHDHALTFSEIADRVSSLDPCIPEWEVRDAYGDRLEGLSVTMVQDPSTGAVMLELGESNG